MVTRTTPERPVEGSAVPGARPAPGRSEGSRPGSGILLALLLLAACGPSPDAADALPWPEESWPGSTLKGEGIHGGTLDSLVADMETGDYGLVDALLVIRHGRGVADHRFEQDYGSVSAL